MAGFEVLVSVVLAVLAGVAITVALSFVTGKVLPALPAALLLAVVTYFLGVYGLVDFVQAIQGIGGGI